MSAAIRVHNGLPRATAAVRVVGLQIQIAGDDSTERLVRQAMDGSTFPFSIILCDGVGGPNITQWAFLEVWRDGQRVARVVPDDVPAFGHDLVLWVSSLDAMLEMLGLS